MKKLCISTILFIFGLFQVGEVLASAKPGDISTLGDVVMPIPLHDSQMIGSGCANDSTYTCSPGAPAAKDNPNWAPPGNSAGDSVHTLEESDAYTDANGVAHQASWSPSFVTGADASDMTMTFYNVKPLNETTIKYGDNVYENGTHLQELFVITVTDLAKNKIDKSFIVFPFSGVAYQMAGGVDQAAVFKTMEAYTGRHTSAAQTTNCGHGHPDVSGFFMSGAGLCGLLNDGTPKGWKGGESGGFRELIAINGLYTEGYNGGPPYQGYGSLGYAFMPRMYQSQDSSFTFSMDLGPMPNLRKVQVDSYIAFSRYDDFSYPMGSMYCTGVNGYPSGPGACQQVLYRNSDGWRHDYYGGPARALDFFYVFSPKSGAASGYTVPSSTKPAKLDTAAFKIAVSDAPDDPYLGTPAQTVPAGLASAGDGCSTGSVSLPALYVGQSATAKALVPPPSSASDQTHYVECTVTAYAVSDMVGYTANTAHLAMQYSSGASATLYCPGCVVKVTSVTESGSAPMTGVVDAHLSWAGTVTGGNASTPLCNLTVNGSPVAGSPFPVNGSTTVQVRDDTYGADHYEFNLFCQTDKGTSQALWEWSTNVDGWCAYDSVGTPTATKPRVPGPYPGC